MINRKQTIRQNVFMLVLTACTVSMACPPSFAVDKELVITQDADHNINLLIEPELATSTRMSRRKGLTMVYVPDSGFASGFDPGYFDIEPALKGQHVVDVQRLKHGTRLIIRSEDVYLSIQQIADSQAESRSSIKSESERVAGSIGDNTQPKYATESTDAISMAAIKEAPSSQNTKGYMDKLAQTKLSPNTETTDAFTLTTEPESSRISELSADGEKKPGSSDELFLEGNPKDNNKGENTIPLNRITRQPQQTVTQDGTMPRILLGLLAVLGLLGLFAKFILPAMVRRFPRLFKQEPLPEVNDALPSPFFDPHQQNRSQINEQPAQSASTINQHTQLKSKLNASGQPFEIITSQSIAPDKSLHLVKIKDRELVIATTPNNISLLADMDIGSAWQASRANEHQANENEKPPANLDTWLSSIKTQAEQISDAPNSTAKPDKHSPVMPQETPYPPQNLPPAQQSSKTPYPYRLEHPPHTQQNEPIYPPQTAQRRTPRRSPNEKRGIPQAPSQSIPSPARAAAPSEIYKKYLPGSSGALSSYPASTQSKPYQTNPRRPYPQQPAPPHPSTQDPYIKRPRQQEEEVVVLQDYDDAF